jgi:hypothetical protein
MGILLIVIGLRARELVPILLPVIPLVYGFGTALISRVVTPTAQLGGGPYMLVYFAVCIATFGAILVVNFTGRMESYSDCITLF